MIRQILQARPSPNQQKNGGEDKAIQIVMVVNDVEMMTALIRNNPYMNRFALHVFDNTQENIGISCRYNDFIRQHMNDEAWIIFCHQDFGFLENPLRKLQALEKNCIYGVIGAVVKESILPIKILLGQIYQGTNDPIFIKHGKYLYQPEVVDTVDCCCIIAHSSLIRSFQLCFDEQLDFHLYGEEFCMNAKYQHGIRTKVAQFDCLHLSWGNPASLAYKKSFVYVTSKYPNTRIISTVPAEEHEAA